MIKTVSTFNEIPSAFRPDITPDGNLSDAPYNSYGMPRAIRVAGVGWQWTEDETSGTADVGSANFSNRDDTINSSDVIARIDELEAQEDSLDSDAREELDILREFAAGGEAASDWRYGETLINDDYFVEYAKEEANSLHGDLETQGWPFSYIDWDAAAQALLTDYTEADFDGVTYWIRA